MVFQIANCFLWKHPKILLSSDGQHAEIVAGVGSARPLPAGMLEQHRWRLPAQTGEPGKQRLTGGLGQIPGRGQALCQPHHQTEVSQVYQFKKRRLLQNCVNSSSVWSQHIPGAHIQHFIWECM